MGSGGDRALSSPAWSSLVLEYRRNNKTQLGACLTEQSRVAITWMNQDTSMRSADAESNEGQLPPMSLALPGSEAADRTSASRFEAERALWWIIGSAEQSSEHPIAKTLTDFAAAFARTKLAKPTRFQSIPGEGLNCTFGEGLEVKIGSARSVLNRSKDTFGLAEWAANRGLEGSTAIAVSVNGEPIATISLRDTLAPYSRKCVAELQAAGIEVWMCTGDSHGAAAAVAKECGIPSSHVVAEALPKDKVTLVERLRSIDDASKSNGRVVAMV